jgi:hypothetical protein
MFGLKRFKRLLVSIAGTLPTNLHVPSPCPPSDSKKEEQDDWEGIIETRTK